MSRLLTRLLYPKPLDKIARANRGMKSSDVEQLTSSTNCTSKLVACFVQQQQIYDRLSCFYRLECTISQSAKNFLDGLARRSRSHCKSLEIKILSEAKRIRILGHAADLVGGEYLNFLFF